MRKKIPLIGGIINLIESLKGDIGIIENTDVATHSIAAGSYVIWKNELYIASSAIAVDDALSSSNLTAVSGGAANELNNNFNVSYSMKVNAYDANAYAELRVIGNVAYVHIHPWAGGKNFEKLMLDIPEKYLPIDSDNTFPVAFFTNDWRTNKSGAMLRVQSDRSVVFMSADSTFVNTSLFSTNFSYVIRGEST